MRREPRSAAQSGTTDTGFDPQVRLTHEYDFVVVSRGSNGAVVARRLAEGSDATVLLIEAGLADIGVAAIGDAARWSVLLPGAYDWCYDYAPTPRVNGRTIAIPRGRVCREGEIRRFADITVRGHLREMVRRTYATA
jgi:choline dehydrogenase-like flavoprotein